MKRSGIIMQIIVAAPGKTAPTTLRLFGEHQLKLGARSSIVTAATPLSPAITTLLATILEPDHTETWRPPFPIHSTSWISGFPLTLISIHL